MTVTGGHFAAVLAAVITLAAPASATVGFTTTSNATFSKSNYTYYGDFLKSTYQMVDFSDDIGIDAEVDAGPAGKYGLSGGAGGSLKASLTATATLANQLSLSWQGQFTTTVTGANNAGGSLEGTPFSVTTHGSLGSTNSLVVDNPSFSADVSAYVKAEGHAQVEGCFIGCAGIKLKIGNGDYGQSIDLAGYSSYTNTATFLGVKQADALPHTFETGDKVFSATIDRPDLSGTKQNQSTPTLTYESTSKMGDISANLAEAVANYIGVPPDVMKGSEAGFNYELLGVYLGVGLDVKHKIEITPKLFTEYDFSSAVQLYNAATDSWSAPMTSYVANNDDTLVLRALGEASLGFVTQQLLYTDINSSFEFDASLQDTIRILGIDGHGLNTALYDHTDDLADLGSLGTLSQEGGFKTGVFANAVTLQFNTLGDDDTFKKMIGFFDGDDDTYTYLSVLNYGSDCNERLRIGCVIDRDFTPITTHARLSATGAGIVFSDDFTLVDQLASLADGLNGEQSDAENRYRRLTALINNGNAIPQPLNGASADTPLPNGRFAVTAQIPEPATWVSMVFGFAIVGRSARRRRAQATSRA